MRIRWTETPRMVPDFFPVDVLLQTMRYLFSMSALKQHNGFIDFSSRIGHWTTFRLLIPLITEETL